MKILDVSSWQNKPINYEQVAKQIDGVLIRCGYTGYGKENKCMKDKLFEKHYHGFKNAGVPVGAYYYSAADTMQKALEEANYTIELLKGKQFELPIFYDVENKERSANINKGQQTSQIIEYCLALEKAGYFVGLYSYTYFIFSKIDIGKISNRFSLWLADYRKNFDKTIPRDIHQYTNNAIIDGIEGGVDMSNLFRTDIIDTIKNAGLNGFEKPKDRNKHYSVSFGLCSKGDMIAATELANKLLVSHNVEEYKTKYSTMYLVIFPLLSEGDKNSICNLGRQLQVNTNVLTV